MQSLCVRTLMEQTPTCSENSKVYQVWMLLEKHGQNKRAPSLHSAHCLAAFKHKRTVYPKKSENCAFLQ